MWNENWAERQRKRWDTQSRKIKLKPNVDVGTCRRTDRSRSKLTEAHVYKKTNKQKEQPTNGQR